MNEPQPNHEKLKNQPVPEVVRDPVNEEPPKLSGTYGFKRVPALVLFHSLLPIIFANSICSAFICICLWAFSEKVADMSRWEKRAFNALSMLLSGALGFGIGSLIDRIGLLARGALLQKKTHSVESVTAVLEGTLESYTRYFLQEMCNSIGLRSVQTYIVLLFLVCSIFGRFGVALLGLAFNLEDTPHYIPPRFRPDWVNLTVLDRSLGAGAEDPGNPSAPSRYLVSDTTFLALSEVAQTTKGPIWRSYDYGDVNSSYEGDVENIRLVADMSHFSSENATMEVKDQWVIFKYSFQDFLGTSHRAAGWEMSIEVGCSRFDVVYNNNSWVRNDSIYYTSPEMKNPQVLQLQTVNKTAYPQRTYGGRYRWIIIKEISIDTGALYDSGLEKRVPRDDIIEIWLVGSSRNQKHFMPYDKPIPESLKDYMPSNEILFNCHLRMNDIRKDGVEPIALDLDYHESVGSQMAITRRIMGPQLIRLLKMALLPANPGSHVLENKTPDGNRLGEQFGDFGEDPWFDYGISRENRGECELWLAGYIGNYITNVLEYLNDLLRPIRVNQEQQWVTTMLVVKWCRVGAILGGLASLQIVLVFSTLILCQGKLQVVDNVLRVLTDTESVGCDSQGVFVWEGERGYRLVEIDQVEKKEP